MMAQLTSTFYVRTLKRLLIMLGLPLRAFVAARRPIAFAWRVRHMGESLATPCADRGIHFFTCALVRLARKWIKFHTDEGELVGDIGLDQWSTCVRSNFSADCCCPNELAMADWTSVLPFVF